MALKTETLASELNNLILINKKALNYSILHTVNFAFA